MFSWIRKKDDANDGNDGNAASDGEIVAVDGSDDDDASVNSVRCSLHPV
jgi:hypothetical protein